MSLRLVTIRSRRFWLAFGSLAVMVLVTVALGSLAVGRAQGVAPQFSISAATTDLVVGDPLRLTLELSNGESGSLDIAFSSFTGFAPYEIMVGAAGAGEELYLHPSLINGMFFDLEYPVQALEPGQTLETVSYVSYDAVASNFAFPSAGSYEVEGLVYYSDSDSSAFVQSNTLTVTVWEPEVLEDQVALALLRDQGLGAYLTPEAMFVEAALEAVPYLQTFKTRYRSRRRRAG